MQLHKFDTQNTQVASLATEITNKLSQIIKSKNHATLAVSGGKSPIALFTAMSHCDIEWEKVTITLVDERFLSTDHEDSNENLVRKNLLINFAEKAFFIGLVTTRNIVSSAANANLQVKDIDVAILGMGEDGHTASIFPCCAELTNIIDTNLTTERYVISNPKTANHQRIGLSLNGILQIPNLYLSINGDKKMNIINQASQETSLSYPISYVLALQKNIQIFWYN